MLKIPSCGTLLHTRMGQFVRMWYQVHIDGTGDICLPMARDSGKKYQSKEDVRENAGDSQRPKRAAKPALCGRCGPPRRQRELQGILRGAGSHADHARAALR